MQRRTTPRLPGCSRAVAQHTTSSSGTARGPLRLISFGFLHGPPPDAERVDDLRLWLRDPATARDVLDLDGRDPRVQAVVLSTPGARELVLNAARYALDLPAAYPRRLAFGCAGGRHRSAGVAELTAQVLRLLGVQEVVVEHRDVHRPRVVRAPSD